MDRRPRISQAVRCIQAIARHRSGIFGARRFPSSTMSKNGRLLGAIGTQMRLFRIRLIATRSAFKLGAMRATLSGKFVETRWTWYVALELHTLGIVRRSLDNIPADRPMTWQLDASALSAPMDAREIAPLQLLEQALGRIDELEPVLNAFTHRAVRAWRRRA
jgi:hypothetical protein